MVKGFGISASLFKKPKCLRPAKGKRHSCLLSVKSRIYNSSPLTNNAAAYWISGRSTQVKKFFPTGRNSWKSTEHEFAYTSGRVSCSTRYFQGKGDGKFRGRSSLFSFKIGAYSLNPAVFPHLVPALLLCSPLSLLFLPFFAQLSTWN